MNNFKLGDIIIWKIYGYYFVKKVNRNTLLLKYLNIGTSYKLTKYYYNKDDNHWVLVTNIFEGINE